MVKKFYFRVDTTSTSVYGGRNQKASIYQHTRSGLKYIGETKWNTASYRGNESEVLNELMKRKLVPKKTFPDKYWHYSRDNNKLKLEQFS